MSRAAEMARSIRAGTAVLGKAFLGTVKLASAPVRRAYRDGKRALDAWKGLSRAKKVWIYRGLLGVGLYVTITERTYPNLDKIIAGVGDLIGKASAGVVTMCGDALAGALAGFAKQMTGGAPWARRLVYWAIAGVLTVLFFWLLVRAIRTRRRIVLEGA